MSARLSALTSLAALMLVVEGKLKRAMELANKFGAKFTLIVGDNEMAEGRYALKNMTTGEQEKLTRDEIAARLANQN